MKKKSVDQKTPDGSLPPLWHRVSEFKIDLKKFSSFLDELKARPPTDIQSKKGQIYGWALTSLTGSDTYGVRVINKSEVLTKKQLVTPTKNCFGYGKQVLFELGLHGFFASRARILAMGPRSEMKFHRDEHSADHGTAWRLHIPIVTNKKVKMQWRISNKIIENHFEATGHIYLVNVSELHRAVNESETRTRFHFVSSIINPTP